DQSNQFNQTSGQEVSVNLTSGGWDLNGQTETVYAFSNSGGTFTTGAGGSLTGVGATITWSGGTNTINDAATVADTHWDVSGGTNTVEGGATGGTLHVQTGGIGFEFTGAGAPNITLNSDATVAGRMLLEGNFSSANTLTGTATITSGGAAANPGFIDLGAGTRTFTIADAAPAIDVEILASIQNGGVTKDGAGTLRFSGVNTYTSPTTVNAGVLSLFGGSAIADSNAVTVTSPGALNVDASETIGSLAGTGSVVLTGSLTAGGNNSSTSFSGVASGGGGFTKEGTGTLTLGAENTYTGGTTVNGGVLELSRPVNSGTGTIRGNLTINNGAIVRTTTTNSLGWGGGTKVNTVNINQGSRLENIASGDQGWGLTVNLDGGELRSNNGVSSTGGQYYSLGGGSSINSLANAGSVTSVISGRINLRESNAANTLTFNVADTPGNATDLLVTAAITQSGTRAIAKTGAGTMLLTGTGTFSGGTTISGGILALGGDSANNQNDASLGTGAVTISNAQLRFGGNAGATVNHFISNAITLNGNAVLGSIDGDQYLQGGVAINGAGNQAFTRWGGKDLIFDSAVSGSGALAIDDETAGGGSGAVRFTTA
ncbi:MAG: autotransporter-associated beta strand repeat-containing protein, partial [Planctomycetales bacterium]|nr:autotransporter-associated beta strand repeat-containing protein [Planctomycetales bacterium]